MSDPAKPGPTVGTTVEEVQGVFPSDAAMQDAVARLTQMGFDRADLSLPAAAPAAAEATPEQGATAVTTDTDVRQLRTMATSMAGGLGAMAAAGAVIATGGLAAVAIGAAAAVGGGAALLANAGGNAVDGVQHDSREDSAARGELVLSVRTTTAEGRAQAELAMKVAGASRVVGLARRTSEIQAGDIRPTASP